MTKTEKFIDSLNKYELSFLYKYKLNTFIKDTQEFILNVMANKNIEIEDIDKLIAESKKQPYKGSPNCKRCNSSNLFYFETEYDNMSTSSAKWDDESWTGKMIKLQNTECAICGYNEVKSSSQKPENWKNKVTIGMIIIFLIYIVYQLVKP